MTARQQTAMHSCLCSIEGQTDTNQCRTDERALPKKSNALSALAFLFIPLLPDEISTATPHNHKSVA